MNPYPRIDDAWARTADEVHTTTYAVEIRDMQVTPVGWARLRPATDRIHGYEIALELLAEQEPDAVADLRMGPIRTDDTGVSVGFDDHTATGSITNLTIAVQRWRTAHVLADPFGDARFPRDAELIALTHFAPRTWWQHLWWGRWFAHQANASEARRFDDGRGWPQVAAGDGLRFVTLPANRRWWHRHRPRLGAFVIGIRCPQCRELRGEPTPRSDGHGQTWINPCGHSDTLPALHFEALCLELARDVWARTTDRPLNVGRLLAKGEF